MKKKDHGCLIHYIVVIAINAIGIYFARTNQKFRELFPDAWISLFGFAFVVSVICSAIKGKVGDFFGEVAGYSRFYFLFALPIFIACLIE